MVEYKLEIVLPSSFDNRISVEMLEFEKLLIVSILRLRDPDILLAYCRTVLIGFNNTLGVE
jgi:hypothetical protein